MYLLVILLLTASATHTKYYKDFTGSNYQLFFDPQTFGIDFYSDPCELVTNSEFREKVNEYFHCTGEWCINGIYSCKDANRDCYEVEHIYDLNRPEYDEIKDIAANRVMAWGKWNGALGTLSYNDSLTEKTEIYGLQMMVDVFEQIEECRQKPLTVLLVLSIVFVTLMGMCLVACIYKALNVHKRKIDDHYHLQEI